jgi:DNA-binding transcriptional ArsR family regulator
MAPQPARPSSRPQSSLVHEGAPNQERLDVASETFRMLSDRTRLHLLWLLTQGEADVTALAEATGGSRTSISQHLAKLRFARMVETRKDGRRVYYRLRDGHLSRLVQEGLNHADHRVTGEPAHP